MATDKDNKDKEVFLSYCTKDAKLAQFLCNQIEGAGVTCWIAPRDIPSATPWAKAIVDGIEKAELLVLLISEASLASAQVEKEIDLADGMKRTILPVRIEDIFLTGALKYHLSNKQWVDALDPDNFKRFVPTIDAILKNLNREATAKDIQSNSVLGIGRKLALSLNEKHRQTLSVVNSMFSCSEDGQDKVYIFFPIRIGATGVNLFFYFDGVKRSMKLYADLATMDDPLKWAFMNIIKNNFAVKEASTLLFPNFKENTTSRRWAFIEFIEETNLTTMLASSSPQECFKVFETNVMAFSDKVMPKLFEWMEYAQAASALCTKLEDKLRTIFPDAEGWRVGVPEWERLSGLRSEGKIAIYKKTWEPTDNYKGRGWLSIVLESGGPFLNDLYFGIRLYEPWHRLNEWKEKVSLECEKVFGKSETPEAEWPWWHHLEDKWKSSGIESMEYPWKDNMDGFIEHCCEKLSKFKDMAGLLDSICADIHNMQRLPFEMLENADVSKEQWDSSIYVYGWLTRIAEDIEKYLRANHTDSGIEVSFIYRTWEKYVYLKTKVESFDLAVKLICYHNIITAEVTNLEQPDFETPVVNEYLKSKGVSFPAIKVAKSFDDLSFIEWLKHFHVYSTELLPILVPHLIGFKKHLNDVVELTKEAESELSRALISADGWVVENKAFSLEKYDSIALWNTKWLRNGAVPDERPPIVIEIAPDQPCFDDLTLVVKHLGQPIPEIERNLGEVRGACDFAFGRRTDTNTEELWKRPLDDPFRKTGGSQFDIKLIEGEQRNALITHIREVAGKAKRMESIIAEACRIQNEVKYKNELVSLIDDVTKTLSSVFPKEEGWEYFQNAKDLQRDCGIYFFKTDWKREGLERGLISYGIECENIQFDNLFYGIPKGSDQYSIDPAKEQLLVSKITELLGGGENTLWWPYYKYFDNTHRYINDIRNDREGFLTLIKDIFSKMKMDVTPLVNDIIKTGSITMNE